MRLAMFAVDSDREIVPTKMPSSNNVKVFT